MDNPGPARLTLIERRRGLSEDRYAWRPFEENERFSSAWWDRVPHAGDDPWFVLVLHEDAEVARIEVDPEAHIEHYAGTPDLMDLGLEIVLYEVSAARRRQGIGTAAVHALAAQHPNRRLVAFSEEADDFWTSLGWDHYLHTIDPVHYCPLFIQPPPTAQE